MCICTNKTVYESYDQFGILNKSVTFKKPYENKLSDNLIFSPAEVIANYVDKQQREICNFFIIYVDQ